MSWNSKQFKQFEFDWETLESVIGGNSVLDVGKKLKIFTLDQARSFMQGYGYDPENPIENAELFGIFQEACSFIRRYFLKPENPDGLDGEIPKKILEIQKIEELFIYASDIEPIVLQQAPLYLWACAILKVMHTISHIDKDLRTNYFGDIQTQIFDRFYKFIHRDEHGQIFLAKTQHHQHRSEYIPLTAFETKPKKSRDSTILKMLHKAENVAEDIFDRVGIRFVTPTKFDALRVVKFLKDQNIIIAANMKPSRARNTMIDINAFGNELTQLAQKSKKENWTSSMIAEHLISFCERQSGLAGDKSNRHTSSHYKSLQFTGRQLIKIRNPAFDQMKKLMQECKKLLPTHSPLFREMLQNIDLKHVQKEIRFFYPYEIQVYDAKSHHENQVGQSSHSNYKRNQVQTAGKRVLGLLIPILKKNKNAEKNS